MSKYQPRDVFTDPEHDRLLTEYYGPEFGRQRVIFYPDAVLDTKATERAGHAVYKLAPYIRSQVIGEADCACQPATQADVNQWPNEWRAFQARPEPETPIAHLPAMDRATARTLTELGIGSVEKLAQAPIVDRIAAQVEIPNDPDADLDIYEETKPVQQVPAFLARWVTVAQQYLALKHFAETGEKPRVKLTTGTENVTAH